jgi:hypothetical protein
MVETPTLLAELRAYRQWVVRNGDKVPRRATDFQPASPIDPAHWTDYDTANAAIQGREGYGLGFVLTQSDPFCVVDLDKTDENNRHSHVAIYNALESYSERSPSGNGCHIWIRGSVPTGKKLKAVEVYSSQRYFTVTFQPIRNVPIYERQSQLNELYSAILKAQGNDNLPTEFESLPEINTDTEIYTRAMQAANGDKFKQLWEGRWHGQYPSQSEADQALYNILAFYTDNKNQVVRLFLKSQLGQRDKAKRKKIQESNLKNAFDNRLPSSFDPSGFTVPTIDNVPLPTQPLTPPSDVEIVTMSTMNAEQIQWLWQGYLPKGKLTLLAGAAGTGKSTLAFSMAATVSTGGAWPDGTRCAPGHVLLFSTEDDPNDTILPRLMAMDANLDNIHYITTTTTSGKDKRPFDPSKDMPLLRNAVARHGEPSLLIIDPIVSAVMGDGHKNGEVRFGLQPVLDFATELNCAVLGITHFSKGTKGSNPADRVIGSVAFTAVARVVCVAAKDEESEQRVFSRAKSNIGLDSGGFNYSIHVISLSNNIEATRIVWGGAIDGSSREILATVEQQDEFPQGLTKEARRFLTEELRHGSRPAKELMRKAKEELGINEKTLQRARQQLGIDTLKDGYGGNWIWSLPNKSRNNLS